MPGSGWVPDGRVYRPPHCCSRCRTPWNCANTSCACHGPTQVPLTPRPAEGWATWQQVIETLPPIPRELARLGMREFQTQWFVRHLVIVPQARTKETE